MKGQTTDYCKKIITDIGFTKSDSENLSKLGNKSIEDLLSGNNPNLLVFPNDIKECKDEIQNDHIFNFNAEDNTLETSNILGFIGLKDTQLTIRSRFAKDGQEDYFLHYMLQKVFAINLFRLEHGTSDNSIFDFLLYMFPNLLKNALRQGLYKEYQKREYNDSNVKGTIDVNRHIRLNIPFAGRIAYNTREYCYDNHITQLIRHTIEYIRNKPLGNSILNNDDDTKTAVQEIIRATGTYDRNQRSAIINKNIIPVHHPYFSKYTALQKICLQILRHDKIKYGDDKEKVYGILFSGSWLWEEYIGIVLRERFNHYYLNKGTQFHLFKDENDSKVQKIIPDYLSKEEGDINKRKMVADAKYIALNKNNTYGEERALAIYYKTVMYMYRFQSDLGFLFYPYQTENTEDINCKTDILTVIGLNSHIIKLGFPIAKSNTFENFCSQMTTQEKKYSNEINRFE